MQDLTGLGEGPITGAFSPLSFFFELTKSTDLGKVPGRFRSYFSSFILLGPDGAASLQTHAGKRQFVPPTSLFVRRI